MRHAQLRAFHYVAQLGGFSRAAEFLLLTQPAISEQVKKLEKDHDVLLFRRENKRVHLTDDGEQLFQITKKYFELEQQMEQYLTSKSASVEGELRIIADSAHHVTFVLGKFRKRYPNISVSLQTGNTEEILQSLRAYNAEIGVLGSLTPGPDMAVLDLGTSEIVAFSSEDIVSGNQKALSLKELSEYPLVFRETGSKTRQKLEKEAKRQGLELQPAITAEGREAVREVVASGAGIGFVSRTEYVRDDRYRPIELLHTDIRMSEAMVHLEQRREVRVIRAFMDFSRQSMGVDQHHIS